MSDSIQDRADRFIDDIRERAQELMEFLRERTGTRKLAPRTVPVRSDR